MQTSEVKMDVPMRVKPLFARAVKVDGWLRRIGLRLPICVIAWAVSRSVQYQINGKWQTIKLNPDEVLQSAFG